MVSGSPLRAPTVTPPVIPEIPPAFAAMAAGEDITVADLTRQLKQAFEEISLGANYPMPTFNGKKGENPEDHCMKAEDYFKVYKIVRDEDKRRRFTDTLFLTARRWAEQLPDTVTNYDFDPDNEENNFLEPKCTGDNTIHCQGWNIQNWCKNYKKNFGNRLPFLILKNDW